MLKTATIALALATLTTPAAAQTTARSEDYLFATNATDTRALWVNPAGLAVMPQASIFGEVSTERDGSDLRVNQWSVGFNSRGISVGYLRNRLVDEAPIGVLRIGFGIPFVRGAIGMATSRYNQDSTSSRGYDFGLSYLAGFNLQLGVVVKHVGRPVVRGLTIPISTVGAAQFTYSRIQLIGEVHATEERAAGESGFDFTYRAGGLLALPTSVPLFAIAAFDLGSNLRIDRLNIGMSIGGLRQVTTVGSAVSRNDSPVFEQFSVAGVAINPLTARR